MTKYYTFKDKLRDGYYLENIQRYTVCKVRGHDWRAKMSGRVCGRCRVFEHA